MVGRRDTNDLTRPSWSWVLKDEVEVNQTDFETYPDMYDYVVDYNWPGVDGIIVSNNTTAQITADNDKYFTFRTTKTGDIIGTSGGGNNSWVCGTGTYFTGNEIESRSTSQLPIKKIHMGSIVRLKISMDAKEDVLSSEFALRINPEEFEVESVTFSGNFSPKWYFNTNMGILTTSDYNLDLSPLDIQSGEIMELELLAKNTVQNLSKSIGWFEGRSSQVSTMDESLIDPHLELELVEVIPAKLYVEVRMDGHQPVLYVESSKNQNAILHCFNSQGVLIRKLQIVLSKGENVIDAGETVPGIYYFQIQAENQVATARSFIQ